MENMKIFDLIPNNGRKSFHGKAQVIMIGDTAYLRSYQTIVCSVCNGKFARIWPGHSCTTMIHINAFRAFYGLPRITSREWFDMEPDWAGSCKVIP